MNPWWSGLTPAQATLSCGEHTHRLRWEAGALHAIDHDDPEAERALAALGGQRCACVDVLDAWARHDTDPRVLVLASRGPSDPLAATADWTAQLVPLRGISMPAMAPPSRKSTRALLRRPARRRATAASASPAAVQHGPRLMTRSQAEDELVALLSLGGGLQERLVATVAATWAARFERGDSAIGEVRPLLHASMQGRLAAAVRGWLGRSDLEVELEMVEQRQMPSLSSSDTAIRAELPFSWLAEVWSRGLAIVWGRFCLAASTEDGRAWTLTTVGADLGPPAPIRVELPETGSGPSRAPA